MILREFRKIFEKKSDFWGGEGPSNRFFERFQTFCDLIGLRVALTKKILRNHEKITTKS